MNINMYLTIVTAMVAANIINVTLINPLIRKAHKAIFGSFYSSSSASSKKKTVICPEKDKSTTWKPKKNNSVDPFHQCVEKIAEVLFPTIENSGIYKHFSYEAKLLFIYIALLKQKNRKVIDCDLIFGELDRYEDFENSKKSLLEDRNEMKKWNASEDDKFLFSLSRQFEKDGAPHWDSVIATFKTLTETNERYLTPEMMIVSNAN